MIENFGIGDLFSFGKSKNKEVIDLRPGSSEKTPPTLASLSYQGKADENKIDFNNELDFDTIDNIGLSDSEKAINSKYNGKLPLLPNYTKNPEAELQKTVMELKGNGDLGKFKKDINPMIQKFQAKLPDNLNTTIPKSVLDKHVNEITDITTLGAKMGEKDIPVNKLMKDLSEKKGSMQCKFLNSEKCHSEYPNFSGASISFPEGAKMKCDSVTDEVMPKAVCTIHKGRINGVYLISKGSGILSPPKVEAVGGGGREAVLKAIVKDGEVVEIKVVRAGEGFHETPDIKMESGSVNNACYLCCK